MKICATCQQSLTDQTEICPQCSMKAGPYPSYKWSSDYSHNPRWTLFPSVPKTQWWGTELKQGSAFKQGECESCVSSGPGVFAIGPVLNLGVGLYEFHCL